MLAGGRAGSWAAQRRRDPKASRQESGYIYLDLSYQGIKVKCDPKLEGSLITLCLPSLGRSGFLNGVRVGVDWRVGSEGWRCVQRSCTGPCCGSWHFRSSSEF